MSAIAERLEGLRARLGARPNPPRLIAVSKRQSASAIREAYAAGQRDFGENYVQELLGKIAELSDLPDLRWHLIGAVQRNKVKDLVRIDAPLWIHTFDRPELLSAFDERAVFPLTGLIEVNFGEDQKAGLLEAEVAPLLRAARTGSALTIRGLMAIPPASDDPEASRPYFRRLRGLAEALVDERLLPHPFELSMGMSHDFEIAAEEGATCVRVGTALFGPRGGPADAHPL